MKKVKMALIWCIPAVLIAVALTTPAIAQGELSLKIWPDQLIPKEPNREYYKTATEARNNVFYAPFDLPNGAKIIKFIYYHYGVGTEFPSTFLQVFRAKLGNTAEFLGGAGYDYLKYKIIPVEVPLAGDPVIRAGYRYYVEVESADANAFFMGAEITYRLRY